MPADPLPGMARHLEEHLDAVAARLEAEPEDLVQRAFPDSEPGFNSRAIVGAKAELAEPEVEAQAKALDAARQSRLKRGAAVLRKLLAGGPPDLDGEDRAAVEAVIAVARPAMYLHDGRFATPAPPWDAILQPHRESICVASRSVGRISGGTHGAHEGSGFVVAPGVVMTNCHVAHAIAASGGDGGWTFEGGTALDFADEPEEGPAAAPAAFEAVIGVHAEVDLALLRLRPAADAEPPRPLRLMSEPPQDAAAHNLVVIGYPARNDPIDVELQRSIFGDRYGVKRVQPGALMDRPPGADVAWHACSKHTRADQVLFHDASTLGGNSGSCVLDLKSGRVAGLHFGGRFMHFNVAVALWRLVDDPLLARLNWD